MNPAPHPRNAAGPAALIALALAVSLSASLPAAATWVAGPGATSAHVIARLNEAVRTLAGPRTPAQSRPVIHHGPVARPDARHPSERHGRGPRGALPCGFRVSLLHSVLPPPAQPQPCA